MDIKPAPIALWPGRGANREDRLVFAGEDKVLRRIGRPELIPFPAAAKEKTGAAVVIAPGGGHRELWIGHEGEAPARWLSERGVDCFVLKYRLARRRWPYRRIDGEPLADMARAIRIVRTLAVPCGFDPARVGAIGFSAGGELAQRAAWGNPAASYAPVDAADEGSPRPDFVALLYADYISRCTLPKNASPAYLLCGDRDHPAVVDGAVRRHRDLAAAGIPAELHVLAGAGHGFGLRTAAPANVAAWPGDLLRWIVSLPLHRNASAGYQASDQSADP